MKHMIRCTLASLLLAAVCLAGTAYAQIAPKTFRVHIPFEFNVGERTFPAGDYSVVQPLQGLLMIRDGQGQTIASAFTHPVESAAPQKPTLRFHVFGSQHTLAEVARPEDGSVGQQLPAVKYRAVVAKQPTVDTEPVTGGTKP